MNNLIVKILLVVVIPISFSFTQANFNNADYIGFNDGVKEAKVSYYGKRFHGRLTANGERFDMNALTCAHKTLKFGTKVEIINPTNGKSVTVRVNDRGPYIKGREFDLSKGAFKAIANIDKGVIKIKYKILN